MDQESSNQDDLTPQEIQARDRSFLGPGQAKESQGNSNEPSIASPTYPFEQQPPGNQASAPNQNEGYIQEQQYSHYYPPSYPYNNNPFINPYDDSPWNNPFYGYHLKPTREPIKLTPFTQLLVVVLLASVVGALAGAILTNRLLIDPQQTLIKVETGKALPLPQPVNVQAVLAEDLPSVVSIYARTDQGEDAGTGMIIRSNGEVLTNNHVIEGAISIGIVLYGQTAKLPASVLRVWPAQDVALLQIQGVSKLPVIKLGNSAQLVQGDSVVAIGNALALQGGPTVTTGIVSALNRTLTVQGVGGSPENLSNLIQTDAPINPGNSGGPLILSSGEVIGMNTAGAEGSAIVGQYYQNLGFAIPINEIKSLLESASGSSPKSTQPVIGVVVSDLSPALIQRKKITLSQGVYVISVEPDSPAQRAGIRAGDVIVKFAGKQTADASALRQILNTKHPGQKVTIVIFRNNNYVTLNLTLGSAAR